MPISFTQFNFLSLLFLFLLNVIKNFPIIFVTVIKVNNTRIIYIFITIIVTIIFIISH